MWLLACPPPDDFFTVRRPWSGPSLAPAAESLCAVGEPARENAGSGGSGGPAAPAKQLDGQGRERVCAGDRDATENASVSASPQSRDGQEGMRDNGARGDSARHKGTELKRGEEGCSGEDKVDKPRSAKEDTDRGR